MRLGKRRGRCRQGPASTLFGGFGGSCPSIVVLTMCLRKLAIRKDLGCMALLSTRSLPYLVVLLLQWPIRHAIVEDWDLMVCLYYCIFCVSVFRGFFYTHVQGLGRQIRHMGLWPLGFKRYGPFLKSMGHCSNGVGQKKRNMGIFVIPRASIIVNIVLLTL